MKPVLEVKGLTRDFGGLRALKERIFELAVVWT